MKYCEDLLFRWDKRIQFEATLLFFFSVVSGSSFISIYMFFQENVILNVLPFLYIIVMFCWWHVCKRMTFDTEDSNDIMKWTNGISFLLWQLITAAVSFGSWDEWGWNSDESYPSADNIYRFMNCLLVSCYIFTLSYDYYTKLENRMFRIKIWMFYIWCHAIVSFAYFVEWVEKAYNTDENEGIVARWLATFGSGILIILGIIVFLLPKMNKFVLSSLFISLIIYWWGSSSLDCQYYADTADMTVMPGYQMLWSMAILILLESLPTMASDIYVLGAELLMDEEDDWEINEMQETIDVNDKNDENDDNDDNIDGANVTSGPTPDNQIAGDAVATVG